MIVTSPARVAAKVPLRRLVGAAFLHFGLIAYLILVPFLCLLLAPPGAGLAEFLALGIRCSAIFLVGLAGIAGASIGVAAALDARTAHRQRRSEGTDAARSERRLASARELGRHRLAEPSPTILDALARHAWQHDDARDQALSRDIERVVATAVAALAATPDRAATINEQTAAALKHLDGAATDLATDRAAAVSNAAQATALYIQQRYGAADFTIKRD